MSSHIISLKQVLHLCPFSSLFPLFCILSSSPRLPLVSYSCTYTEQREVLLCRLFKMLLDPRFLSPSLSLSAVQISLLIKLSIVLICWARGIC